MRERTEGKTAYAIARDLNKDAVPTAQGARAWSQATVRALLMRGRRSRGIWCDDRGVTETHPPRQRIASPTLWALTSGITGFVANVLLVLDQLTENVGEVRQYFSGFPPPSPG